MAPENRKRADEAFRELETKLAELRTTSKALRDKRPSVTENLLHPGRRAKDEAEFGGAIISALKEFAVSIQTTLSEQESKLFAQEAKLGELERQISGVRNEQTEIARLRERHEQLEKVVREQADAITAGSKRAADLGEKLEQWVREQDAKIEKLGTGQTELGNEFRERLQHLLDEHRVAMRQLALKASEDAILSDRARRATELKLEELARRVASAPPA
jgi:chromosome segregation ATPase